MNGSSLINSLMYDVGKIQVKTTDTNYRLMALEWCKRVVKDIQSRQPHWDWLERTDTFSTTIDQLTYSLPDDIDGYRILSLKQTTSPTKLTFINQREFDYLEPKPTDSSGNPYIYTVWGNGIRLYPIPDAEITMIMRYLKNTTAPDDGTTALDIPDKYEDIVLDGMKVPAFSYEPEWGNPVSQKVIYNSGIQRMIRDNSITIDNDGISKPHFLDESAFRIFPWDKKSVG